MLQIILNNRYIAEFYDRKLAFSFALSLCANIGDCVSVNDRDEYDFIDSTFSYYRAESGIISWDDAIDDPASGHPTGCRFLYPITLDVAIPDKLGESLERDIRLHTRTKSLTASLAGEYNSARCLGGKSKNIRRTKKIARRSDRRIGKEMMKEHLAA